MTISRRHIAAAALLASGASVLAHSPVFAETADDTAVANAVALSDQTVAVAGPNAIVRHAWLGESESGGKSNVSKIGVLQVWQKQGADWKLLARQAFAKPA